MKQQLWPAIVPSALGNVPLCFLVQLLFSESLPFLHSPVLPPAAAVAAAVT